MGRAERSPAGRPLGYDSRPPAGGVRVNVVFLSPHFPPQFWHFCAALKAEGATVLAIGDTPAHELSADLRSVLDEYYVVPDMNRYDDTLRAMGWFVHRYGRIDRIDSLNEHWLELEARLREDFNIPGQRPADTARNRSKTAMKEIFRGAGIETTEGEKLTSTAHAWALAEKWGYPLVVKPDVGVGAARTFRIRNEAELRAALAERLDGYVMERFEPGVLTSFDGLVDRQGRIVFCTSHLFSAGIMDIVNSRMTMHYYNRRELPPVLEETGRRAVEAFGIRERFFHFEFFETEAGTLRALEVNVRPPGGFTTDLMNYSADVDIYRLWAQVLTGKSLEGFSYERRYHVAHVGRRYDVTYRHPHGEVLERVGAALCFHRAMPPILAGAMGDHMYVVRHPELEVLEELIGFIEAV